jgi:hypothetical protein
MIADAARRERQCRCSAQVTHALNLGSESKVALTAPTAKFEYLQGQGGDAEVWMVPPGQNAATIASASVRALA